MNVLYKLTAQGGFHNTKNIETYFEISLKKQDDYFNCNSPLNDFKEDDEIYFVFNNMILAKANFTGDKQKGNDKFKYSYKLKNIEYKTINREIDFDIVGKFQTMKYVKDETIQAEINKMTNW